MKHQAEAESLAQAMQTAGSAQFHKFISTQEFVSRFADSDAEIAKVKARLAKQGYTVTYVFANHLAVEATASAGASRQSALTRGTDDASVVPATLMDVSYGMAGGGRRVPVHSNLAHSLFAEPDRHASKATDIALAPQKAGSYLPRFFEDRYGVSALHKQGLYGQGQTVGVLTLAPIEPNDVFQFWKLLGLTVDPNRLTVIDVDGGQELANPRGSGETDLDAEESGAIASRAKMRVYVGNLQTEAGFSNGFEAVASENSVDTVSVSWGLSEALLHALPHAGSTSSLFTVRATHEAMLEMALQGQTVMVASGDDGAYDAGCSGSGTPSVDNPVCGVAYTVDWPSSDPLALSAGGTTTPFTRTFKTVPLTIKVNTERSWGWSYISDQAAKAGFETQFPKSRVFSDGGGGGVSTLFKRPWYQNGVEGLRATQPNQAFTYDVGNGVDTVKLPAYYHGRNVPDISANADPNSGYQFISGGALTTGEGGTSFVAPLFNGSLALVAQGLGGRVGQVQPILYYLRNIATKEVTPGDNWGVVAKAGFDDATGLGLPDMGRLLLAEKTLITRPDQGDDTARQTTWVLSAGLKVDSAE